MKEIMVKSNFKSADELFDLLLTDRIINQKKKHLAFVILENNKIPWSWYSEKMSQYLYWNMQGGVTGAGSGHNLFYRKDLHSTLIELKEKGFTHAMFCRIGMLISGFADQVKIKTPIQNFYEFSETDEYMRAHILAKPGMPATIHTQHFEINLTKWTGKSITELGDDYIRSPENIHDDYTPLWIETSMHPKINNFTHEQRQEKWFLYPHRDYEKHESIFYNYLSNKDYKSETGYNSSNIFINQFQRKRKRFYYENNEALPTNLNKKYDVIITPTSGVISEVFYDLYGHENTKVIIYDYDQIFLDIKQKIIEYGFVGKDLIHYMNTLASKYDRDEYIFLASRTPNQFEAIAKNDKLLENNNGLRMLDNLSQADYEMKLCNMLEDNFNWLDSIIKDKSVLCYTSNIFKYYAVWMHYDLNVIKSQYELLVDKLSLSKDYELYGRSWK